MTYTRALTQDELDGVWRSDFVEQILNHIEGGNEAKFAVSKGKLHLCKIAQVGTGKGEWTMSIGKKHYYTYRLSDVVSFIEQIYDCEDAEVLALSGEIDIEMRRVIAAETGSAPPRNRDIDPFDGEISDEVLDKLRSASSRQEAENEPAA